MHSNIFIAHFNEKSRCLPSFRPLRSLLYSVVVFHRGEFDADGKNLYGLFQFGKGRTGWRNPYVGIFGILAERKRCTGRRNGYACFLAKGNRPSRNGLYRVQTDKITARRFAPCCQSRPVKFLGQHFIDDVKLGSEQSGVFFMRPATPPG